MRVVSRAFIPPCPPLEMALLCPSACQRESVYGSLCQMRPLPRRVGGPIHVSVPTKPSPPFCSEPATRGGSSTVFFRPPDPRLWALRCPLLTNSCPVTAANRSLDKGCVEALHCLTGARLGIADDWPVLSCPPLAYLTLRLPSRRRLRFPSRRILSLVVQRGGVIILENPTSSLVWLDPACVSWCRLWIRRAANVAACRLDVIRGLLCLRLPAGLSCCAGRSSPA